MAVCFLDHRGSAETPCRVAAETQPVQVEPHPQGNAIAADLDGDAGRADAGFCRHSTAIAVKAVRRPSGRWREVEFVIRLARRQTEESLEAGVPPQLVGARGCRS